MVMRYHYSVTCNFHHYSYVAHQDECSYTYKIVYTIFFIITSEFRD